MLFNSIDFLVFFPIVVLVYFIIPIKKYIWLLACSYFFYACMDIRFVPFLITSTLTTYICGLLIEKYRNRKMIGKIITVIGVLSNLLMLLSLKYLEFFVFPIGISFYTLQVIGYLIEVYREKGKVERNIAKYALFVSFFPIILSGPIERTGNFLKQISKPTKVSIDIIRHGLLTIAWGIYLKLVIADNISVIVYPVFENYQDYKGIQIVLATFLYGIQIYADFYSYSQIAIGTGKILGFDLIDNFNAPYLSKNIREFWDRWHISLTSWFRDYLYIPLGGNRYGKTRKYVNILIVFSLSGIWHGSSLNFLIWGILNALYLIIYDLQLSVKKRNSAKDERLVITISKYIFTFFLINVSWFFFLVSDMTHAVDIILHSIKNFNVEKILLDSIISILFDNKILFVLLFSVLLMFLVDLLKKKGISYHLVVFKQRTIVRWMFYIFILVIIITCGAYGENYEQKTFIYVQF